MDLLSTLATGPVLQSVFIFGISIDPVSHVADEVSNLRLAMSVVEGQRCLRQWRQERDLDGHQIDQDKFPAFFD